MKKQGSPQRGELVVCRVVKLYPNSATVELIEYGKTGIVHVSEVALRWVTDIREFIKEQQIVVCKVMEPSSLSLSIKRVRKEEAASKLNEFNRERKAEKVLELVGKGLGKNLEQSWQEAGAGLVEGFGSLTKGLDMARKKPALLLEKGLTRSWVDALAAAVAKSEAGKTYTVKAALTLTSYAPDGVQQIKKAFSRHAADSLTVKYISAPTYLLEAQGSDRRQLEARIAAAAEVIVREIQKGGGTGTFALEKR